jgi:predicted ribosome quality control (RQC) complex YloA/Tae2 family protein
MKYAPAAAADRSRPDRPPEQKLGKHTVPNRLMPRRYRSAGGLEIWVGRSAAGNDHLSLRLARGKDLFFHLDGAPGSHVVLRTEGRTDPPAEALLDACELAVHFSKFKNATRADVHAVPIANVRKPKGSKPGLVSVHGGKTIHLRRAEARLKRILEARIDGSS